MSGPMGERLSGQLEWALVWAPWSLANAGPALQSREQSTFSAGAAMCRGLFLSLSTLKGMFRMSGDGMFAAEMKTMESCLS